MVAVARGGGGGRVGSSSRSSSPIQPVDISSSDHGRRGDNFPRYTPAGSSGNQRHFCGQRLIDIVKKNTPTITSNQCLPLPLYGVHQHYLHAGWNRSMMEKSEATPLVPAELPAADLQQQQLIWLIINTELARVRE